MEFPTMGVFGMKNVENLDEEKKNVSLAAIE